MKKQFYLLMALAASLGACSEEHFPDELAGGYGTVITATLPVDGFDSRVDITVEGTKGLMAWSENDVFAAFSESGGSVPYSIVPEQAGKAEATFKAPLDIFIPQYAFFPSHMVQKMEGKVLTLNLPATYSKDMNSQNSPMLGKVADNAVAFRHVSGIIRINFANLPEGYNTVKVVSSSDISGTFKIMDVDAEQPMLVLDETAKDHGKEVTIAHPDSNEPYFLALPAGHYDELHIYAVGEKTYQLYDAVNKDIACGQMINVTKDYSVGAADGDFKTLRDNILKDKLLTPAASTVDAILSSLDKDKGSFNDVDYTKAKEGEWKASKHLNNMLTMVSAYINQNDSKYFGNDDLHKAIESALNFWVTEKPEHWNWWNHEVEEGKDLGVILVKMSVAKTPLNADLKQKVVELMIERCGHPFDKTGANRTDIATHWLYRASATDDKEALDVAYNSFLSALSYTVEEGFQHDGSFFQHGPQLYIGGYGEEILKATTQIASLFVGTNIEMPTDKLDILSKFVRETFFATMRGKYMSYSVMGRSVSRKGNLDKSYAVSLAERMKGIDPAHAAEYDNIIKRINGSNPSVGVVASHKHFFNADYTLHIRPEYTIDVRMVSENTCRVERGNNENLKGYYMADGTTNILVDGGEYFDIMPSWNWSRLPGVTIPNNGGRVPSYSDWGVLGTSQFAGGVSDGLYGASAYSYYDDYSGTNTGANKSWFFFDKEVVCMGSVETTFSKGALTTVNQCLQKGEVVVDAKPVAANSKDYEYTNPKCIYHSKVGYVFPEGGDIWVMNKSKVKGRWNGINKSETAETINNVFGVGFKHDNETNKHYAYVVVPGITSAGDLAGYTGKESPIAIVTNTADAQSVYHKTLDIWQTVIFNADKAVTYNDMSVKANRRCIVMIEKSGEGYKVFVADPGRTQSVISLDLTLPGNVKKTVSFNFSASKVYAGATKMVTVSK